MLDSFSGSVMMPATRSIRGQIVVALYTYQGSEFGDMTFKKGDMMEIVDDRYVSFYFILPLPLEAPFFTVRISISKKSIEQ